MKHQVREKINTPNPRARQPSKARPNCDTVPGCGKCRSCGQERRNRGYNEVPAGLIAAMDAEERAFNRLRDELGPFANFGNSGDQATVPRRNSGRREDS